MPATQISISHKMSNACVAILIETAELRRWTSFSTDNGCPEVFFHLKRKRKEKQRSRQTFINTEEEEADDDIKPRIVDS